MELVLNWQKSTFDSNYQVLTNGLLKFSLNFNSFQNTAIANTQKGLFLFKTNGITNSGTEILNDKNEVLATINYDWFNFKAKITYATGEVFSWSFQNNWLSRWTINNGTDKQIIYHASTGNGIIRSNIDDDILLISGLFIREYYARILFLIILILFVPILFRGIF